jgi:hypothetical protein
MKIIRTANLLILETYLTGGQVNMYGDCCEGFNDFNSMVADDSPRTVTDMENLIESLIYLSDDLPPFNFYEEYYRFKLPHAKNLRILARRMIDRLN